MVPLATRVTSLGPSPNGFKLTFNRQRSVVLVFLKDRLFFAQRVSALDTTGSFSLGARSLKALRFVFLMLWRFGLVAGAFGKIV